MTNESNQLLRSAYEIAKRNGENTNWPAFLESLKKELLKQALDRVGLTESDVDVNNEQVILRATSTARTYRMPPRD